MPDQTEATTARDPLGAVGRWCAICFVLITVVAVVLRLPVLADRPAPEIALAAIALIVALTSLSRGIRSWHVAAIGIVAVAAVLVGPARTGGVTGPDNAGGFLYFSLAVSAAALQGRPRRFAIQAVSGGVVYVVARTWHGTLDVDLLPGIDEFFAVVPTCFGLVFVVSAIRSAALTLRRAEDVGRAATDRQAEVERTRRDEAEVARVLHDEIITALLAVARSSAEVGRRVASGAVDVLRTGLGSRATAWWELGAEPSQGFPRTVVDIQSDIELADWPEPVVSAITGAVAEALRNVARHAGVDVAAIMARTNGRRLTVTVRDDGAGFDPSQVGDGFGLSSSVRGRMHDVGGEVTISSAPGRGTAVEVSWPARDADVDAESVAARAAELPLGGTRALVMGPMLAFAVGQVWIVSRQAGSNDRPVVAGLVAVVIALVVVVSTWLAVRGRLTALPSTVAVLVVYAALGTGLWAAGAGALRSFDSWVVGYGEGIVFLLALTAPVGRTIVAATGYTAIVWAVAVLDPGLSPVEVAGPISLLPVHTLILVLLISVVRRYDRLTRTAQLATVAAALAQERDRGLTLRSRRRLAEIQRVVEPYLIGVAAGRLELAEQDVRDEAGLLAAMVRDDLVAPTLMTDEMRSAVTSARRRGSTVTFRPIADDVVGDQERRRLVAELGRLGVHAQMTVSSAGAGQLVLVVQPSLTSGPAETEARRIVLGRASTGRKEDGGAPAQP